MHKKAYILATLIMVLTTGGFAQEGRVAQSLKPEEFKAKLETVADAVLLDVRTQQEVDAGVIPNAKHIDFNGSEFPRVIGELDREKTYFVYCASGGRSGQAAALMADMGFKKVYNLEGGLNAWKKKKYPIKKP